MCVCVCERERERKKKERESNSALHFVFSRNGSNGVLFDVMFTFMLIHHVHFRVELTIVEILYHYINTR